MKTRSLNFEELLKCKDILVTNFFEPSYMGFAINVSKSFLDGTITEQQKDELIKSKITDKDLDWVDREQILSIKEK